MYRRPVGPESDVGHSVEVKVTHFFSPWMLQNRQPAHIPGKPEEMSRRRAISYGLIKVLSYSGTMPMPQYNPEYGKRVSHTGR